jgi:hypothetical protein
VEKIPIALEWNLHDDVTSARREAFQAGFQVGDPRVEKVPVGAKILWSRAPSQAHICGWIFLPAMLDDLTFSHQNRALQMIPPKDAGEWPRRSITATSLSGSLHLC